MEGRLDGGKEVGDVGLIRDVLGVTLWEDECGGLNYLVEGDNPVPVGPDCPGDLG